MPQNPQSTPFGGIDPQLVALAGEYLDDGLGDAEALAFERRLAEDRRAGEALRRSMAARRLLDGRDGGGPDDVAAERGEESRDRIPVSKRPDLLFVLGACGLVVAGAALALPLYRMMGTAPGSAAPAGEVSDLSWPLLPLLPEELPGLAALIRDQVPDSDGDAVSEAMAVVARRDPGFIDSTRRSATVTRMLHAAGSSGLSGPGCDRAAFLLVFLHDARLGGKDRKEALQPLCAGLVEPGRLLWNLARTTDSSSILQECLTLILEKAIPAEEIAELRGLFDRAVALGSPAAVKAILWSLVEAGHPDAPVLGRRILQGSFGAFGGGEFPEVAGPLFKALEKSKGRDGAIADLSDIAAEAPAAGRFQVLALLCKEAGSSSFGAAIVSMAGDDDVRVRRGVVHHIRDSGSDVDRAVLEKLAADADPAVRSAARELLSQPDRR